MMAGYYCFDADYGGGYLQDMRNFQLEWRNEYRLNDAHTTTASLAWNRNDFDCLSGGTTDNQYKNQENIIGFSVEHRYTPTQNWNISLAGRLDHSNVHDALFSTRAAASYSFNNAQTRVFPQSVRATVLRLLSSAARPFSARPLGPTSATRICLASKA